jgi:hypothetical protein
VLLDTQGLDEEMIQALQFPKLLPDAIRISLKIGNQDIGGLRELKDSEFQSRERVH